MSIKIELSEDEYNMLIQMLVNSNPLIQTIAKQANPQIQKANEMKPAEVKAPDAKTPEVVRPVPSFERERDKR